MKLSNEDVQEILRLLDDSDYDELQLQTDEFTLTLKRSADHKGWTRTTRTDKEPAVTHLAAETDPLDARQGGDAPADAASGLHAIRAPMVGTFYKSPKPGAAPFVTPGGKVNRHSVIAIIEVMKLMNSIEAGVDGEIVEVLVEDAQFVEKGQVLMWARLESP